MLRQGSQEELLVADLLRREGFTILEQNYLVGKMELDIIAMEGDLLCFIEVKSRKVREYLEDLDLLVPPKKERMLINAADAFCRAFPKLEYSNIRFDFALLYVPEEGEPECRLVRDAFRPTI